MCCCKQCLGHSGSEQWAMRGPVQRRWRKPRPLGKVHFIHDAHGSATVPGHPTGWAACATKATGTGRAKTPKRREGEWDLQRGFK